MRHRIAGNRLSRNSDLRWVTVRDLAKATLIQQRITTTRAKAKEARKLVDKLISLGKNGTLAAKRHAFAILCDHKLVSDLFNKTSSLFKNRVGGYTRIIPLGTRRGDNAKLALLELTEKTEIIVSKPKAKDKKKIVETTAIKAEDSTPKVEHKHELKETIKETHVHKDAVKSQPTQDKFKSGKKIITGLKKIFNRKIGSS